MSYAAFLLLFVSFLAAQNNGSAWSERAKPIVDQIRTLRNVSDDERGEVTRRLAVQIRGLAGGERVALASELANLSTEGDYGRRTLQEVATTLAEALRSHPMRGNAGKPSMEYVTLAQLQKYEHVNVNSDDPQFAQALAQLDADDTVRQNADFALSDLDGQPWHLRELRGKEVLVNFWATWCPPCRKEMPDLDRLARRFKGQGLVILGITDEQPEKVKAFIATNPVSYPILIDPERKVNELFRVSGIPKSFIYNRQGRMAAEAIDMRTARQFSELLSLAGLN